jgi:hypothetical protein
MKALTLAVTSFVLFSGVILSADDTVVPPPANTHSMSATPTSTTSNTSNTMSSSTMQQSAPQSSQFGQQNAQNGQLMQQNTPRNDSMAAPRTDGNAPLRADANNMRVNANVPASAPSDMRQQHVDSNVRAQDHAQSFSCSR